MGKSHPKPGVPRGVKPKELKNLLRDVWATDGWLVVGTNNHVKVISPDGEKIFTSVTARSPRVVDQVRSDLRRIGWDQ